MKRLLTLVAFFATLQASAQQVNPVPDYVFRNQMSVGRGTVTDTAAYFSIGPRYGANKGFMPPIVGDTATFSSGKRNGLLIFSVQKNKFLYWDSVRVQWSDMAGSSGSYITGSGIAGYLPQFSASTTLDTSALFTLGNRLGIGTSTFAYNSTNTANMELNGTAGGILGFKRNDSARGYLWHTGDNMELANTAAGSISFNTYSATRGSISSAGVWRLHNLAGTGDRVVQASSNGTLSASTSVTGLVDTLTISTRAWRQKGDDSLGAIIATKGSGTVTSVATGYGLSGGTITSTGTLLVDTLNIATRAWRQKGLDSLAALEVSGSGTTNYVAKFTAGSTIGNSQIFDNGTNVGIGTSSPNTKTEIFGGDARVALSAVTTSTFRGYQMATGTTEFASLKAEAALGELRLTSGFAGFGGFTTFYNNGSERMRIFANGRVFIGASPTDAGYQLDINGTLRSVNGANFATTSGNVGIGTASPQQILHANATTGAYLQLSRTAQGGTTSPFGGIYFGDGTTFQEAAILSGADGNVVSGNMAFYTRAAAGSLLEGFRVNSTQEMLVGGGADAGDYKLQVSGNIYNTGSAVLAATSGNVGVGVTPSAWSASFDALQIGNSTSLYDNATGNGTFLGSNYFYNGTNNIYLTSNPANAYALFSGEHRWLTAASGTAGNTVTFTQAMTLNAASELLVNTTSDAGDYKLQVVGNARIGTGKLDIASNTTFGIGIARSGTSEVAGQIYNSNGILYLGAESSAGGQIFSGSSAYAAVIGSGANYPLQFAANNITRATLTTNGNFMIGFPTDTYFYRLQVNGSIFSNNQIIAQNAAAQLNIDSSTNISPLYISNQSLTGSSAQGLFYGSTTWNTTGNPSLIDLAITNTASGSDANYIKISDGSNIFRVTKAAEVVTAAPTGGSIRKWRLGEAATVSPTSPNRTIRVEIDGTVYYLHAKTTND